MLVRWGLVPSGFRLSETHVSTLLLLLTFLFPSAARGLEILTEPEPQAVVEGQSVSFSVRVRGESPLRVVWSDNTGRRPKDRTYSGSEPGEIITITDTLTFTADRAQDELRFGARVNDTDEIDYTRIAPLTVYYAPYFLLDPRSRFDWELEQIVTENADELRPVALFVTTSGDENAVERYTTYENLPVRVLCLLSDATRQEEIYPFGERSLISSDILNRIDIIPSTIPNDWNGRIQWFLGGGRLSPSDGRIQERDRGQELFIQRASLDLDGQTIACRSLDETRDDVFIERKVRLQVLRRPTLEVTPRQFNAGDEVTISLSHLAAHHIFRIEQDGVDIAMGQTRTKSFRTRSEGPLTLRLFQETESEELEYVIPSGGGDDGASNPYGCSAGVGNLCLQDACAGAASTLTCSVGCANGSIAINGVCQQAVCPSGRAVRGPYCVRLQAPRAPLLFGQGPDTDGDGYSDALEEEELTSSSDPGSNSGLLSTPLYSLWNSFLGMVNVLELVNGGDYPLDVRIDFFLIDGTLADSKRFTIPRGAQRDEVLNSYEGFTADSYGLIEIHYDGELDGRLFFYRSSGGVNFDFAYGVGFQNPSYGKTSVGFNTFNPGDIPGGVANWLSLVNLSQSTQTYLITTFDMAGNPIRVKPYDVAAFRRIDLDGGHSFPGPSHVGTHEIIPLDPQAPYLAQLTRYGFDYAGGYTFAFPLIARAGNGQATTLPISNRFDSQNWVELTNTEDQPVNVEVHVFNSQGELVLRENPRLDSFAQIHLPVFTALAAEDYGLALITPDRANSVSANSMQYYRNADGGMSAMYGSQSKEVTSSRIVGTYNLFLNMESYLRVVNPLSVAQVAQLKVSTLDAQGVPQVLSRHRIDLAPFASVEVSLHQSNIYETQPDSYGTVVLESDDHLPLYGEILRYREVESGLDFVAPTLVR